MGIANRPVGPEGISLVLGLCALSGLAAAQQPTQAQASAIRQACRGDYMANCSGVPTGGAAALQCLQQNAANVSPGCRQALQAASGASAGTATTARPDRQASRPGAANSGSGKAAGTVPANVSAAVASPAAAWAAAWAAGFFRR